MLYLLLNKSRGSVMVTCVAHNHKTENDFGGSIPSLATNFKSMKKLLWLDDVDN